MLECFYQKTNTESKFTNHSNQRGRKTNNIKEEITLKAEVNKTVKQKQKKIAQ